MDKDAQAMLGLLIGMTGGKAQEWADAVEKSGQSEVVHQEKLPKDTGLGKPDLEPYRQLGIVFGKEVDDLFIEATLPPGWKKVRTDHYMWSKVLDAKGRERISIFYKPEFYDRQAHMCLRCRFSVHGKRDGDYPTGTWTIFVADGETTIRTLETVPYIDYEASRRVEKQAEAWLDEHYPDWRNPTAYWD